MLFKPSTLSFKHKQDMTHMLENCSLYFKAQTGLSCQSTSPFTQVSLHKICKKKKKGDIFLLH